MIYVKIVSGLGNQLFQYSFAKNVAIKTGVKLKFDLSFYENQALREYKLDKFNIDADIATEQEINYFFQISLAGQSPLERVARKIAGVWQRERAVLKEQEWWRYEPAAERVHKNTYVDGYWQHVRYFTNLHPLVRRQLTIKAPFLENIKKEISTISADTSSVSIHIRRGDYVTDQQTRNFFGVQPLDYYNKAVELIRQKIKSPSFYIFSDDLNWAKDHLKLSAPASFIDVENGSKDYLELDLMARCRYNIIANSSFSWWGAFLNANPNKIVIAPKKWVIPENVNERIELCFPTWIQL